MISALWPLTKVFIFYFHCRTAVNTRHTLRHNNLQSKQILVICSIDKLAPYGTDGRLLLTANFKVT